MDNVPSSAILAIVAIVLACLFAAFAFSAVQSQKTSGSNAMVKVEGMNTELDESDLTQYDGQILTGSQVIEAIKKLKDTEGVTVSTTNATGKMNLYGNNVGSPVSKADTPAGLDSVEGASFKDAASKAAKPTDGTATVDLNGTGIQHVDTTSLKNIGDKNKPDTYVTPSRKFRGTVHRNTNTNSIDWIEFTQQN